MFYLSNITNNIISTYIHLILAIVLSFEHLICNDLTAYQQPQLKQLFVFANPVGDMIIGFLPRRVVQDPK